MKVGSVVWFYACKRGGKQGSGSRCLGVVLEYAANIALIKRLCRKKMLYYVDVTDSYPILMTEANKPDPVPNWLQRELNKIK